MVSLEWVFEKKVKKSEKKFVVLLKIIFNFVLGKQSHRGVPETKKTKEMKATVKQIFEEVSYLNPKRSEISSLGSYISESSQMVADVTYKEVIQNLPGGSLAYKILFDSETISKSLTDKQLWVIAFELQKNEEYCENLGARIAAETRKRDAKISASNAKLAANKEATQNVLDYIKSNGKKLGDYYAFLKKNYPKQFYSKKYFIESANEFLSK